MNIANGGRNVRASHDLYVSIRRKLEGGDTGVGDFLPTERELAKEHGVAPMTARRALKRIESEGLIRAESRRGYRVLARVNNPTNGHPLAFVLSEVGDDETWRGLSGILLQSVRKAALERGWSVLGVGAQGKQADEVIAQCRVARAWGAVMDTPDAGIVEAATKAGLSVVLVDDWHEDVSVDTVLQDDFRGGFLAGRYLAAKGHKNIAWFGSMPDSIHHIQRLSGARSALHRAGIEPAADWARIVPWGDMMAAVRERLSRRDRPTAVLALWHNWALAVGAVARELGLSLGRDLELVGWCSEQQYEKDYVSHFAGGQVPATVVWDPDSMAETAIARLSARRDHPEIPPTLLQVNVNLREAQSGNEFEQEDNKYAKQVAQPIDSTVN